VSTELEIPVDGADGPVPRVHLIDARREGLDPAALQARARAHGARGGARYTSRSYRFPLALVACHQAPVGVDIERIEHCEQAFGDSISTPAERASRPVEVDLDRVYTSLWSSKEALSKALGDALAYDPRRLEGPGSWPRGRSGPWRAQSLDVDEDHVAWLCWRADAGE
jgi:hypothetical protein